MTAAKIRRGGKCDILTRQGQLSDSSQEKKGREV